MNWREIEKIRVDGIDYDLEFVDPDTQVKADKLGAAHLDDLKIKLLLGNPRREIQTLWHEIIHIIDDNRLGYVLSETQTNTLGCALYQVFADNPDLLMAMYLSICGLEFEPEDDDQEEDD
ncbi:MAG: hypothetical protein EOM59_20810 [Clostridia bacterium]|nr:hypothetical protein [Clostridia bacterium]